MKSRQQGLDHCETRRIPGLIQDFPHDLQLWRLVHLSITDCNTRASTKNTPSCRDRDKLPTCRSVPGSGRVFSASMPKSAGSMGIRQLSQSDVPAVVAAFHKPMLTCKLRPPVASQLCAHLGRNGLRCPSTRSMPVITQERTKPSLNLGLNLDKTPRILVCT